MTNANKTSSCIKHPFIASHWNTAAIAPCNGVIGLGFGTPLYGKNFILDLAATFPTTFSATWSYSTRPYLSS
jgi:hypothetical protein